MKLRSLAGGRRPVLVDYLMLSAWPAFLARPSAIALRTAELVSPGRLECVEETAKHMFLVHTPDAI